MNLFILIPVAALMAALFLVTKISSSEVVAPVGIDVQERIAYHASKWRLDPALVKAFAKVESNFNPKAKNPSDPSYGLMQITPGLVYDYGLIRDPVNPSATEIGWMMDIDNNLSVACDFLDHLSKYPFQQQVMSYNVGEAGYKNGRRNWDYFNKVSEYYESYN